uniref:Uncharacterized protein n=2 Tax=Tetraselmis sp. GSL018 TaxID=582737 RepID=A0A061QUB2_9CHLO
MPEITPTVKFSVVAREWRCKWSSDNDKASLNACQALLDSTLPLLKAIPGVKNVQRVVCGSCLDFKVITGLEAGAIADWEANGFAPEKQFLEKLAAIPGVTNIETQTYTLENMLDAEST